MQIGRLQKVQNQMRPGTSSTRRRVKASSYWATAEFTEEVDGRKVA